VVGEKVTGKRFMSEGNRPGIPVDAFGGSTIDPTKNVLDLVEAQAKRLDGRIDSELQGLKEYFKDLMAAHDKRYEQRYEAQQKALDVALVAQKDAVKDAFAAQREAINAALTSQERAVAKAEVAAEKRFEGVNEFRAQLGDQQRTLMPRAEAENRINVLSDKIGVLEGFRTEVLSKGSGAKEGYGQATAVVGVILALLSIISVGILLITRLIGT